MLTAFAAGVVMRDRDCLRSSRLFFVLATLVCFAIQFPFAEPLWEAAPLARVSAVSVAVSGLAQLRHRDLAGLYAATACIRRTNQSRSACYLSDRLLARHGASTQGSACGGGVFERELNLANSQEWEKNTLLLGTTSSGEYLPIWSDRAAIYRAMLRSTPQAAAGVIYESTAPVQVLKEARPGQGKCSPQSRQVLQPALKLRTLYFPGWQAVVERSGRHPHAWRPPRAGERLRLTRSASHTALARRNSGADVWPRIRPLHVGNLGLHWRRDHGTAVTGGTGWPRGEPLCPHAQLFRRPMPLQRIPRGKYRRFDKALHCAYTPSPQTRVNEITVVSRRLSWSPFRQPCSLCRVYARNLHLLCWSGGHKRNGIRLALGSVFLSSRLHAHRVWTARAVAARRLGSCYAMPREPFESALLLHSPPMNKEGDTAGDLGMGRQTLLLL